MQFKWLNDSHKRKPLPENVFKNGKRRLESIRSVMWREKVTDDGFIGGLDHLGPVPITKAVPILLIKKWTWNYTRNVGELPLNFRYVTLCVTHWCFHHYFFYSFLLLFSTQGTVQLQISVSVKSLRTNAEYDWADLQSTGNTALQQRNKKKKKKNYTAPSQQRRRGRK